MSEPMAVRETTRNPRKIEPTDEEIFRERKQERRETLKWIESDLRRMLYQRGPDSPWDGVIYEGPIGWDVVVICPDSRDLDDPMFREPYSYGSVDAWLVRGGELWKFVHGSAEEIVGALP